MKGYVINLDHRTDRMELFNKNEFPFEVERISGEQFPDGNGVKGCAASHIKAISGEREFPFVVFEDDCQMIEPWSTVEKAMRQLPNNWDALWLGATLRAPLKRYSPNLYHLKKIFALHAIIYNSKRIVEYIIKYYSVNSRSPIDGFYSEHVLNTFNCFIVYPLCATQRDGVYSDIQKRNWDCHTPMKNKYYRNTRK